MPLLAPFLFITAALQLTDNQILALLQRSLEDGFWTGQGVDAVWLLVAYPIGAAIGPLLITRYFPSFRGRRAVVTGLLALAMVQWTFSFQPEYSVALTLRALAGAASGILSYALLIEAVAAGNRAVTVMTSGFLLAYVLLIPSGKVVADELGPEAVFRILGGVSVALVVAAAFVVPTGKRRAPGRIALRFRQFLRDPVYRAGLVTSMLVGAALAGPVMILPRILADEDIALVYYIGGLGPLLALPLVSRCLASIGRRRTCVVGALALAGPLLALPIGMKTATSAAAILLLALTIETLRRTALQGHIGALAPDDDRPRYLSLRNVAVQISVSGGIALAVFLNRVGGFAAACAVAAALAAASALFVPGKRQGEYDAGAVPARS